MRDDGHVHTLTRLTAGADHLRETGLPCIFKVTERNHADAVHLQQEYHGSIVHARAFGAVVGLNLDPPIDCVRWAAWESENALLTWENATCLRSA